MDIAMKFNDVFEILKTIDKAVNDPTFIADSLKKSQLFNFQNNLDLNSIMNNASYTKTESNNNQYNETVPIENNKFPENNDNYNNYENNDYNKQKAAISKEEGLLDSITQELTSARLQQAIILSEIVGKPKSKTRKRRRF